MCKVIEVCKVLTETFHLAPHMHAWTFPILTFPPNVVPIGITVTGKIRVIQKLDTQTDWVKQTPKKAPESLTISLLFDTLA